MQGVFPKSHNSHIYTDRISNFPNILHSTTVCNGICLSNQMPEKFKVGTLKLDMKRRHIEKHRVR